MNAYIVYRHGSNKSNQSMTQSMPVGCYEAESEEAAKKAATEEHTCYANQYLSAELAEDCSKDDQISAQEYQEGRRADAAAFAAE